VDDASHTLTLATPQNCLTPVVCRYARSTCSAHKLYPVRIRLVNIVGAVEWVTVAYIPVVRKLQEPAADTRAKLRRCGVLQRVLYAAFREYIGYSHLGFGYRLGPRRLKVFPRTLLYLCDRPEERAVLCQKGGQCARPCSVCMVKVEVAGAASAVNAPMRKAIDTLEDQTEAHEHMRSSRNRSRRATLEAVGSNSSYAPAFGGTAGLGTEPQLLFHLVGFDILHVRCVGCFCGVRRDLTGCHSSVWRMTLVLNRVLTYLGFLSVFLVPPCVLTIPVRPQQVLDLGVTRMLVHRLVAVFPYMCCGKKPVAGSYSGTRRVCFFRLLFMGRRCKACKTPPGCVRSQFSSEIRALRSIMSCSAMTLTARFT